MKKRSVLAVVIFSIITLGIYDLFWLASVKKELNAKTKEHVPSLWLLFSPLLLLALVVLLEVIVKASSGGSAAGNLVSILVSIIAIIGLIIIPVIWFLKFSRAVNEYTSGELSTAIAFILLWILRFIGMAVIQDKFNDMIDQGTSGNGTPQPVDYGPQSPQPQVFVSPQPPSGQSVPPMSPPPQPAPDIPPAAPPAPPAPNPLPTPPQPPAQIVSPDPAQVPPANQPTGPEPTPPMPPSSPA